MTTTFRRSKHGPQVSIVIPARNEAENVGTAIRRVSAAFGKAGLDYEIVVVDDNSTDATNRIVRNISGRNRRVRLVKRSPPPGFGRAIRDGFGHARGEVVVPIMADLSDDPNDAVRLVKACMNGADVAYGSRFIKGSKLNDYPPVKLVANRLCNKVVGIIFGIDKADITNAFKAFRRGVLKAIGPLSSESFEITVEMPVKAHLAGFGSVEVPVSWSNRTKGRSKMRLALIGYRYLSLILRLLALKLSGKSKRL